MSSPVNTTAIEIRPIISSKASQVVDQPHLQGIKAAMLDNIQTPELADKLQIESQPAQSNQCESQSEVGGQLDYKEHTQGDIQSAVTTSNQTDGHSSLIQKPFEYIYIARRRTGWGDPLDRIGEPLRAVKLTTYSAYLNQEEAESRVRSEVEALLLQGTADDRDWAWKRVPADEYNEHGCLELTFEKWYDETVLWVEKVALCGAGSETKAVHEAADDGNSDRKNEEQNGRDGEEQDEQQHAYESGPEKRQKDEEDDETQNERQTDEALKDSDAQINTDQTILHGVFEHEPSRSPKEIQHVYVARHEECFNGYRGLEAVPGPRDVLGVYVDRTDAENRIRAESLSDTYIQHDPYVKYAEWEVSSTSEGYLELKYMLDYWSYRLWVKRVPLLETGRQGEVEGFHKAKGSSNSVFWEGDEYKERFGERWDDRQEDEEQQSDCEEDHEVENDTEYNDSQEKRQGEPGGNGQVRRDHAQETSAQEEAQTIQALDDCQTVADHAEDQEWFENNSDAAKSLPYSRAGCVCHYDSGTQSSES
jgi:hypothetical protein